ncbi:hypothetical protein AB5N19_10699 [Seiridium cardinale]|uniref:Uncharacterized protein n=1 Tax=Seiridium cardinale TaxID=138064 RepID=A0ABR2XSN3_9PEZI
MSVNSANAPATGAVILRRTAIIQFPFAFILLLSHGLASGRAFPAIGLLPLSLSTLLSALLLNRDSVAAVGSPVQALTASNVLFLDIMLALFQLGFLIPTWVTITKPWNENLIVLGTYASVFMMIDFGIHTYFVLKELWHMCTTHVCNCPHCQVVRQSRRSTVLPTTSEYTLLQSDVSDEMKEERDLEAGK